MRNRFDRQLHLLDEQLTHMGELCETAIAKATQALKDGSIEQAKVIIAEDEEIDQIEKDIERLCLKLLLQQQPVAKDLRRISAALKMITDMERIGDQTSDIAEIILSSKGVAATDEIHVIGTMASEVSKMVRTSVTAYVEKDLELARSVMKADDEIDQMEKEIERLCLKLLLQQQPVAKDLRRISAALKMITDMERIGDQTSDIAEIIISAKYENVAQDIDLIGAMATGVSTMVRDSVVAYVEKDLELARKVMASDDKIDAYFDEIRDKMIAYIKAEHGEQGNRIFDLIMVTKYLERIGDHATNIAEWVEFSITGVHKDSAALHES